MPTLNPASRWRHYLLLMRLHRPIGILLLLWPTLWALWIAGAGRPAVGVLAVFVAGVVLMRSAGCVINDYADRDIDPYVERTRMRPLAAGQVSAHEALVLFAALSLTAFALVLSMNKLTITLSVIGAALAASYPFVKRYTHLAQVYLGASFGWSIPMGFAAQTGAVPAIAWVLFAANIFWVVAYDTAYAMVDRDDDLKIGVKSTAILFGTWDWFFIGLGHFLAILLLAWAGRMAGLGFMYYSGLVVASSIAGYQQGLLRRRQHQAYFRVFLNNNYFGAAVFAGLLLEYGV